MTMNGTGLNDSHQARLHSPICRSPRQDKALFQASWLLGTVVSGEWNSQAQQRRRGPFMMKTARGNARSSASLISVRRRPYLWPRQLTPGGGMTNGTKRKTLGARQRIWPVWTAQPVGSTSMSDRMCGQTSPRFLLLTGQESTLRSCPFCHGCRF